MKLTQKDKDFLERLKKLISEKELTVELYRDGFKRLVLRKNYGDRIEQAFGLTRQGVRWRFNRLFNGVYVSAYETIYIIESMFGTELRGKAMEIAKERVKIRKEAKRGSNS